MRSPRHSLLQWVAFSVALAVGTAASVGAQAQSAGARQVLDLNRQGMEAYNNLNLDQARALVEQALAAAQRENVTGAPLARTYLNLGVISIGGFGDNAQGLEHFRAALAADASAQLDPLTSTPDIQSVFALARASGGSRPTTAGSARPDDGPRRGTPTPAATFAHEPVPEQLRETAIPVYVDAPESLGISRVDIHYRAPGMREYRNAELRRLGAGFGFEIPCTDVFEPAVSYYLEAFGADGASIARAGTAAEPFQVPIVAARSGPPPALPGQAPPERCSADTECPPGMECAGGQPRVGLGGTCRTSADCQGSLSCEDNFCVVGGEADGPSTPGEAPRAFLQVGASWGSAWAGEGMAADTARPLDDPDPDNSPWQNCNPDGFDCDVRVQQPGFVPTVALRVTAGYYVTPSIAVAAYARYQLEAGAGSLANLLLGARAQLLVTTPTESGFHASVHAGGSVGQIQPRPQQDGIDGPFILSGMAGAQLGSTLGFRFSRNIGIFLAPELDVLFPTFLLNVDVTGGLEFSL